MSKRDDDSQSDIDVGMTTAERRRRRRRGGGLRVPSDNVPRRSTTPPVVAPVPEDPSLAMSIAYSFTNDASEPVPRVEHPVPTFADPVSPDAMSTVIDPPTAAVEPADFEMKTREMSSVDLAALGLEEPGRSDRSSAPVLPTAEPTTRGQTEPSTPRSIDVDMDGVDGGPTLDDPTEAVPRLEMVEPARVRLTTEPGVPGAGRSTTVSEPPPITPAMRAARTSADPETKPADATKRERLRTVALSEEDLEEVREAVRAQTQPSRAQTEPAQPQALKAVNVTQPLTALDVEVQDERSESLSVPEIDINELAERSDSVAEIDINDLAERSEGSGEFEVDVEDLPLQSVPQAAAVTPPPPAPSPERRSRPPSVPPPLSADKQAASPPAAPAKTEGHAPPPPPPKAPPAPPKSNKAAVAPVPTKPEAKGAPRGKPWFVDLFDEDYLRTLPFLTPQATQSEAEFVIDAMGLQPGAQVIDIGCGYGRHAMELAARGFHVVGLDLSTPLLVRGGEEAARRNLEINFIRGDMRELDFEAQFDGAYCLFSTFGYFDDETNKKTIANIARALKPGGRVMLEILNRDYIIADLPTRVWWEGEGCVVLEEVELNYFSSRIQINRSVVFDDGRQLEQEISVRAYSLHEVGKLMHAAGFRVLEVSGGYHTRGRFFGNQSRHIIVLAERKDGAAT